MNTTKLIVLFIAAVLLALFVNAASASQNSLSDAFTAKRCVYPQGRITLLVVKDERRLEVWGTDIDGEPRLIKEYPVLAASGCAGPKLRQGDCQVPEGIYSVSELNPQSRFHLSMKIDYPNAFDREMARLDGRTNLGGDIFIHGHACSKGCLAMGDEAIEELYRLVSDTGTASVRVIIAPYDFRYRASRPPAIPASPSWVMRLYRDIKTEMARYVRGGPDKRVQVSLSR